MNDDFVVKNETDKPVSKNINCSNFSVESNEVSTKVLFVDSDPVLSVKRSGNFNFQLNSGINGGNLPLDSQGLIPERRFSYSGNEEASSLPGEGKFGVKSIFNTCDSLESHKLARSPLQHLSGVDYIFSSMTPTFAQQFTGALIRGGTRVISAVQDINTRVDGGVEITTSQTFVYRGAGEEQIYIVYQIPTRWDDGASFPEAPRELGSVTLLVTNVSQNRFIYGMSTLEEDGHSPGELMYYAIELKIKNQFPWVSANETIRVDLVHKCYSSTVGAQEYKLIGAATGFVLLNARPNI